MACRTWVTALALVLAAPLATAKLDLKVFPTDGSYSVSLGGRPWLSSAGYRVGSLDSVSGSLTKVGHGAVTSHRDALGTFDGITLSWAASANASDVLMRTTFKTYKSNGGMIVFEQHFPHNIDLHVPAALEQAGVLAGTAFPSFARASPSNKDLAVVSYYGVFPAMKYSHLSDYQAVHQSGSPIVIYDESVGTASAVPSVILSPLNFPKAHHMFSDADSFGGGVKASVTSIPGGWTQSFLLSGAATGGINVAFMAWGDRMLKFTGKPRADMYRDQIHGTIGFWTDNGGYYHYATGMANESYEQVLPKVKAYHAEMGVPFRHWQFDSWFYPKDGPVSGGGAGGAVVNWTAMPSVFPHGMAYIQDQLKVPMAMHNRQWSIHSDYVEHGPFEWYVSRKAAVPKDPEAFFHWFFKQQPDWGLSMYEQDWMCTEYDEVEALQTNITMGDLWLRGMADGAAASGRAVQYCMPYVHDVLAASAHAAVTNARASGDYFHAAHQWAIGAASLLYWAIGILPFKDGFYSSTEEQVGGQTVGPELHPDREALMATLSCAMVGPMDGISLLNKTRVMRSCRADGYVLKPDRPLSTSDRCFLKSAGLGDPGTCFLYTTHSMLQGHGVAHYVYSDDGSTLITPDIVGLPPEQVGSYYVYNWYTGDVSKLHPDGNAVAAGYEGHVYASLLPMADKSGWVLVGEVDKYVHLSTLRFKGVEDSATGLVVAVEGVGGDVVRVCAVHPSSSSTSCQSATFDGALATRKTVAFDESLLRSGRSERAGIIVA